MIGPRKRSTFAPGTTERYLNWSCSFSPNPKDDEKTLVICSITRELDQVETKRTLPIKPSSASFPLAFPRGIGKIELSSTSALYSCCIKQTMLFKYVFSFPICPNTLRYFAVDLEFEDDVKCRLARNVDGS